MATLNPDEWWKVICLEEIVHKSGLSYAGWCVGISTDPATAVYDYHHVYGEAICLDFVSPLTAMEAHRLLLRKGSLPAKCATGQSPRFLYAFPVSCATAI